MFSESWGFLHSKLHIQLDSRQGTRNLNFLTYQGTALGKAPQLFHLGPFRSAAKFN